MNLSFFLSVIPVKACIPTFTIILSRLIFKVRFSTKIYLTMIPIISGVGLATVTELNFDTIGFIAGLSAAAGHR